MYRASGKMMPDDGLKQLEGFDAIFFGAVGAPERAVRIGSTA